MSKKILLVGCGKMGASLLSSIIGSHILAKNIIVIEPHELAVPHQFNVKILKEFHKETLLDFAPDCIIFAVKPQTIAKILPQYQALAKNALIISIIAGKNISFFENNLGKNVAFIRTMPNLPVTIGSGAIAWFKNANVTTENEQFFQNIFAKAGLLLELDDESLLNAVTAISGSGPAYLFYFIECMQKAALNLGLPAEIATKLVLKTIEGSAALAAQSVATAANLRQQVTSPAGTTEAALKILMHNDVMQDLITNSAKAACARSLQLEVGEDNQ